MAIPPQTHRRPPQLARGLLWLLALLLAGLLAGWPGGAHAQQALHLDYLVESAGPMDAETVRQLPASAWQQTSTTDLALGYTAEAHWFRVHLPGPPSGSGPAERLLEIAYPLLDHVELTLSRTHANGTTEHQPLRLGDKLPFAQRPLQHANFVVPVSLPPGGSVEVLARVRTSSSLQFPLRLWAPEAFHQHNAHTQLLQGGYIGVMLGLLVYNLILWLTVRERSYLFYVIWVGSLAGCLTSVSGLSFQYLWPEATQWNDTAIVVLLSLATLSGAAFATDFVRLGSMPRWQLRLARGLIGLTTVNLLANFFLPYSLAIQLSVCNTLLMIAVFCGLIGIRAAEGYAPARIFLLAFGAVLLGGVMLILGKFGLIERTVLTESAAQIGSAIEVLVISLGLASRLNQERAWREAAQANALRVEAEAREQLEARVTERTEALEQANRKLSALSLTDGLTGIPNRRFLDDSLERVLAQARAARRTLAVALVDVDHFKRFNDNHGHLAGDACLQAVARELQMQAQRGDDLVARYGGEEFCVLMPQAGTEGALIVAERIREAVSALVIETSCGATGITVSVGICCLVPGEDCQAPLLLQRADEALYQAKRNGRNRVELARHTQPAMPWTAPQEYPA
ncbi:sensor domain-containing diguanylate cyclase [Ideonella sp.]|uniref:sensor domain-containing diguanylate cyclase n=1 Tax=Ideonella sp. TaxID=1929293 RepID=UPI003BB7BB80